MSQEQQILTSFKQLNEELEKRNVGFVGAALEISPSRAFTSGG